MTIATRFKTVSWSAVAGAAALGCYLVSLQVASERAKVADTERALLTAQQDIRALNTELGTRSRLVQLERWNADVLSLPTCMPSMRSVNTRMAFSRFSGLSPSAGRSRLPSDDVSSAMRCSSEAKLSLCGLARESWSTLPESVCTSSESRANASLDATLETIERRAAMALSS